MRPGLVQSRFGGGGVPPVASFIRSESKSVESSVPPALPHRLVDDEGVASGPRGGGSRDRLGAIDKIYASASI
jgi:hypothetical protein